MTVELSSEEVDAVLTHIGLSKMNIGEAAGTPHAVRRQNLERLEAAERKLRTQRKKER